MNSLMIRGLRRLSGGKTSRWENEGWRTYEFGELLSEPGEAYGRISSPTHALRASDLPPDDDHIREKEWIYDGRTLRDENVRRKIVIAVPCVLSAIALVL